MNSTWTKTPPTKPGAYWWRDPKVADSLSVAEVFLNDGILTDRETYMPVVECGGEWCGPLVPVEEVRKAYYEGHIHAISSDPDVDPQELSWPNSRARRVVEGDEKL